MIRENQLFVSNLKEKKMVKKEKKVKIFVLFMIFSLVFAGTVFSAESDLKMTDEKKEKTIGEIQLEFIQGVADFTNVGELEKAIALFDSVPEELKNDNELFLIKASLLISAGKYTEAQTLLNSLESKNPQNIDVLEMKIILAKAIGSSQKINQEKARAISKVLALDPNNPVANIELGQQNVLQKKYKLAKGYFQKALIKAPTDLSAIFGIGQTSYYLGDLDDSKLAFKKMLVINPNEAIAYQYLGKLEAEDENYKKATEFIEKAILLDSSNFDFYMDLGTYKRFLGKFDEAEKAWTKAISLNPSYFLAYAYRAGLYDELGKFDLALNDYRKVIETNPKYYFAYEALGILAWHAGNWEEARVAFEKAYSYNKENISYPLMISACYIKMKKLPQAKMFLAPVMKTKTDRNSLDYMMLRLFHDQGPGNAESAIALKIQKEEKATQKGKMLYYFGLYYSMKGNTNLAAKYFAEVTNMQSPLFFEYRLAEWGLQK